MDVKDPPRDPMECVLQSITEGRLMVYGGVRGGKVWMGRLVAAEMRRRGFRVVEPVTGNRR